MGALHQGHGKLLKQSQNDNQKTVMSIFVNEKQFNKKEDFDKYPEIRVGTMIFVSLTMLM